MPTLLSTKRHISSELDRFGARPIVWDPEKQRAEIAASAAWAASPAVNNTQHPKPIVVGLSIRGCCDITTLQGPIADEAWDKRTTDRLEDLAQYQQGVDTDDASESQSSPPSAHRGRRRRRCRKLSLPEMVHPMAHVKIEVSLQATDKEEDNGSRRTIRFHWNALDALTEWAQAHAEIPLPHNDDEDDDESNDNNSNSRKADTTKVLTILKTKDAQLWKEKRRLLVQQQQQQQAAAATTQEEESLPDAVLHYDWSFSTPYLGTTSTPNNNSNLFTWHSLPTSGLNMSLLTDQSVPILYFDDITLMEDDLHDNGQVQYSIKIRVMPTCAFVLTRLWLRVDHVLVRCRETRFLMDFTTTIAVGDSTTSAVPIPSIHRDVSWRECAWEHLAQHHLPSDLRTWQLLDQGLDTPEWQGVLKRIPAVPQLPAGIHAHAKWGANEQ